MIHTQLDSCQYLYLAELLDPGDNGLRIIVEEAKASDVEEDIEVGGVCIPGTRAIEHGEGCRSFEITWDGYVAYSVRNESFTFADNEEQWQGRLFCLYSRSHFIDYVSRATIASDEYPGPLRHWSLNCLNHIIDVVAVDDPEVRQL